MTALERSQVKVPCDGGAEMDAYFARPKGSVTGSLVIIQEIFGVTVAMREIARVLRKGGLCCITVPYAQMYRETYTSESSYYIKVTNGRPAFFERHYDDATLRDRLIAPSGLEVVRVQYFGEPRVPYEKFHNALPYPLKIALAPASRLATRAFIAPVSRTHPRNAMTAILTLRK